MNKIEYDHNIFDLYDYQGIYPLTQVASDRDYMNSPDFKFRNAWKDEFYKSEINNILAYKDILLSRKYGGRSY